MKYLLGALIGVSVTVLVVFVLLSQTKIANKLVAVTPTASPAPAASFNPTFTSFPSVTPEGSGVSTGNITGKLCYPSEFLPEGVIEAKEVNSDTVVSMQYAGSGGGAGSTYSLAVPAGTYILRYKVSNELSGYHTDVCPTGLETSCNGDNSREHLEVEVIAGQTISNIDLCDFYYSEATNPGF